MMAGETLGGKWGKLLSDPDLERWHRHHLRQSQTTAKVYLRRLGRTLETYGQTPSSIVKLEQKERDDVLWDIIDAELSRGLAPGTVDVFRKALLSWLQWNGVQLVRPLKVPNAHVTRKSHEYQISSQDDLARVLNTAVGRTRVCIAVMAFSGVRPQVLGNEDGTDGLKLGDLADLRIEDGKVVVDQVPMRIDVRRELSKAGHRYFTFLGKEGTDIVVASLQKRLASREELGPSSSLVRPVYGGNPHLQRNNISTAIRKPMRHIGIQEPPYIWRSYFENRGMMTDHLKQGFLDFFMGHTGDISARYGLHKNLNDDVVDKLRASYQKMAFHLETRPSAADGVNPFVESAKLLLRVKDYTEEEIEGMDLESKTSEELVAFVKQKSAPPEPEAIAASATAYALPAERKQEVVQASELDTRLANGWIFKHELRDGWILMESA